MNRTSIYFACLNVVAFIFFMAVAFYYADEGPDYFNDYVAGRLILENENPYNTFKLQEMSVLLKSEEYKVEHIGRPPMHLVFFLPLALLSFKHAVLTVNLLNLLSVPLIAWLILLNFGWPKRFFWGLSLFCYLAFNNSISSLYANPTALTGLLIVASLFFFKKKRDLAGAFFLSVAVAMKLFPGFLLFALLVMRKPRAFFASVALIFLWMGISAWVIGFENFLGFFQYEMFRNGNKFMGFSCNLSLGGLVYRLIGLPCEVSPWQERLAVMPEVASWLYKMLFAGMAALCFFVAEKKRSLLGDDGIYALFVLTMCLISPLTWLGSLSSCIIAVAFMMTNRPFGFLSECIILMTYFPVDFHPQILERLPWLEGSLPWYSNLVLMLPTWGMLLLFFQIARIDRAKSGWERLREDQ